jgi:hypothetical protein
MTDRELLEAAAKAAGYELQETEDGFEIDFDDSRIWNPLTDDGDALRLAVKLNLITGQDTAWHYHYGAELALGLDPLAATRRAVVRAAAAIGKEMK